MQQAIAPGVWWLTGTHGSNVFLLETADGRLAVIDCGFSRSADAILRGVAEITGGGRPSHVLLTHAHPDHAGSAAALRAAGATIVAGMADCDPPSDDSAPTLRAMRGRHGPPPFWPFGRGARHAVVVDQPLVGECEVLPGLLAVATPGHTAGSYSFIEAERGVAFVGDLVISHHDGLARPLAVTNADDARYLESLRSFAERAPEIGCAGHGPPVIGGFGAELRALAARPRRSLLSPSLALARLGRLTRFSRDLARTRR